MIDHESRYYDIENAAIKTSDNTAISYKRRRFIPAPDKMETKAYITVIQGHRPDIIAAETLGDPLLFWQICDANNCMNPFELTKDIGRKIKIGVPAVKC